MRGNVMRKLERWDKEKTLRGPILEKAITIIVVSGFEREVESGTHIIARAGLDSVQVRDRLGGRCRKDPASLGMREHQ